MVMMTPQVLRCIGFAGGGDCPVYGQFLKTADLEHDNGRGMVQFAAKPEEAMRFPDKESAIAYLQRSPACCPLRPDGQPNRPLTSTHWEILPLETAVADHKARMARAH
jgi:hypothetical protein